MTSLPPPDTGANQQIATRLRGLLAERKLKATDMAKALKKSPQSARRWLAGRHDFSLDDIQAIAEWLDIDFDIVLLPAPRENREEVKSGQ